jgi:hypothetical protein
MIRSIPGSTAVTAAPGAPPRRADRGRLELAEAQAVLAVGDDLLLLDLQLDLVAGGHPRQDVVGRQGLQLGQPGLADLLDEHGLARLGAPALGGAGRAVLVFLVLERLQAVQVAPGDLVGRVEPQRVLIGGVGLAVAPQLRERLAEPVVGRRIPRRRRQDLAVQRDRLFPLALGGQLLRPLELEPPGPGLFVGAERRHRAPFPESVMGDE